VPRPVLNRGRHDAQRTDAMTQPVTLCVLDLLLNGYL